jgi:hypothetical protein
MPDGFAEQMTGMREHPKGFGKMYNNVGEELTVEQAQDLFEQGGFIEVPNAGAGSYGDILKALGYKECKEIDWTSSAGDWTFAARDDEVWYIVYQSPRYPQFGYSYSRHELSFDSYEEACNFVNDC